MNSGFVAGTNTLDFIVYNRGNGPTGLRVEMTGTATAIPEPASWALMTGGFGMAGAMLRRRRSAIAERLIWRGSWGGGIGEGI